MTTQRFFGSRFRLFFPALIAAGIGIGEVQAQPYSLNHLNSSVNVNVTSGFSGWTVDGINQLGSQWFYYRVGNGAELPIESIDATPVVLQSSPDRLDVLYANSTVSVNFVYILTGNTLGSGSSGVNATISVRNLTANPLDLHFFQYSDFNLSGTSAGDSVLFSQSLGRFNKATQSDAGMLLTHTFTSGFNPPSRVEAGNNGATLASLTDGAATTLNNVTSAGPGNVNYTIQWDVTLQAAGNAGDGLSIGELMSLQVPEPTAMALVTCGVLALVGSRLRRK